MNPSKRIPERDNLKKTYMCWVKNILFNFLKYFKIITSTIFAENQDIKKRFNMYWDEYKSDLRKQGLLFQILR